MAGATALLGATVSVVASFAPPLRSAARHYVVFESLQFALLALVTPALVVVGAAWADRSPNRRSPSFLDHWSRSKKTGFRGVLPALLAYIGALVVWQLPGVVDAVQTTPALTVLEGVAFFIAGTRLWSELVSTPQTSTSTGRAGRIGLAVLPMWTIWVLAYFIGFARSTWFPSLTHPSTVISTLADQQFATGLLWTVSAMVFLPVIFSNFIGFLSDDGDLGGEPRRFPRREHRTSKAS
ncbi:MAG TPA: cytochrome c oxidase assembly protein [Acidimicrobiales bacterium]|nr:cytochrome c oxidase assembly protein [Acidimicrobiales bacterium]